jgi:hypothetical protein
MCTSARVISSSVIAPMLDSICSSSRRVRCSADVMAALEVALHQARCDPEARNDARQSAEGIEAANRKIKTEACARRDNGVYGTEKHGL